MNDDNKMLPFEIRRKTAQEMCKEILDEYDCDICPILVRSPQTIGAQLTWVDKQNAQQMADLGLIPLPQSHEAKADDEKLNN